MPIVGADIAKRSIQVCVQDETGRVLQEKRLRARREDLSRLVEEWQPEKVLLEASTSAEWVARTLEGMNCKAIVANPNFTPMYATMDKKVKTDKRDARALADALRLGAFRESYRVSDTEQQLRQVLSSREQLIGQRSALIVLIKSQFEWYGEATPPCRPEDFWWRTKAMGVPEILRPSVLPLLEALAGLEDHISQLNREVEGRAKSSADAKNLETVPGVGPIVALGFLAALCNKQRFKESRQVGCFLGIVPSESSSGEKRARGSITKSGDQRARGLLVQAAWALVRSKDIKALPLQQWFAMVAARRGKRVAIVGLARKLSAILFVIWRDGVAFDSEKTRPKTKVSHEKVRHYGLKEHAI
jgi:transposase